MVRALFLATAALALAPFATLAQTAPPATAQATAQPAAQTAPGGPAATVEFYAPPAAPPRRDPESTVAEGREVVTAADPRAAAAGVEMLRQGGSAADAIVATMLALNVIEPESSGIGGGGFLLYHQAKNGETVALDGREKAPAAAGPRRFLEENGQPMPFRTAVQGGYSVGVPGALALAAALHQRFGKLSWAALFQPAIRAARDGVTVTARLHGTIERSAPMLLRDPAARKVFFDAAGKALAAGAILKQPELAATLTELAEKGPDAFYKGPVGAEITAAVAHAYAHPTVLAASDLASYRAMERPTLCEPYRSYVVCSMGPPSYGGIGVLQILKQLERFDLKSLGPDNLLSQHLFAESQRLSYADREAWGGDSDFVAVPVAGLLSDSYIRERSALIRIDRAMKTVAAGTPPGAPPAQSRKLADPHGTTHFAAVDGDGNIASYTNTIEGVFGSGLMAGGFMLNNELTDFDFLPERPDGVDAMNAVQPGKRPRSSMAPTMIFDAHGKAVATFGAAGGATIIAQVAKAVIAYIDWGMSVEDAIAAPQILADRNGVRLETGTRLAAMAAGLKALGHDNIRISVLPLKGNGLARTATGWRGAADPRSEGKAEAVSEIVPEAAPAASLQREAPVKGEAVAASFR